MGRTYVPERGKRGRHYKKPNKHDLEAEIRAIKARQGTYREAEEVNGFNCN